MVRDEGAVAGQIFHKELQLLQHLLFGERIELPALRLLQQGWDLGLRVQVARGQDDVRVGNQAENVGDDRLQLSAAVQDGLGWVELQGVFGLWQGGGGLGAHERGALLVVLGGEHRHPHHLGVIADGGLHHCGIQAALGVAQDQAAVDIELFLGPYKILLEDLGDPQVIMVDCPFAEGTVAAVVQSAGGGTLEEVKQAAEETRGMQKF